MGVPALLLLSLLAPVLLVESVYHGRQVCYMLIKSVTTCLFVDLTKPSEVSQVAMRMLAVSSNLLSK